MNRLRGRFDQPIADAMLRFSSSLDVDLRMFDEDIDGSIAHATMLGETGILSDQEAQTLLQGLEQIRHEFHGGTWHPDPQQEDIHMAVEARLIELVGPVGGKLHTARSRNDQVATDTRLWLRRKLGQLDDELRGLIRTLLERVEADGRTLMPGYTHLQRGQPIWLGHHLLAHTWTLVRDRARFADAARRGNACPLGAGAMAGTSHPIRRERTAELLGFADIVPNAMDAVASRDHEQEIASACAICATHLSRMAEELVLWSSVEFGFMRLGPAYATGSSIMPQKRNPDAAELIRGKARLVQSAPQVLLSLTTSLPMAYNRDLQEARRCLFDAIETTLDCLHMAAAVWATVEINRTRFSEALVGDFALATELADALVERGVPFADAHHAVGQIVHWCEQQGQNLSALTPEVASSFHPQLAQLAQLADGWGDRLDPESAVERRRSAGGTAWSEVSQQVHEIRTHFLED